MIEKKMNMLKRILKGVELSCDELQFLKWLSGWDIWTVQQMVSIIKKCRDLKD